MIDSEHIRRLLNQGMGPELHWHTEDVPVSRLAATLTGMANAAGGTVLLGITPRSGHVLGVADPAEAIDRVFQAALLCEPPLVLPVPRLLDGGAVQVLSITVPSGLPHVFSLDGRYLGREGVQNNPLPARRLRQLLLERGVLQFETQVPAGASLDDLDDDQVAQYIARFPSGMESPPEEILLRRGCLKLEERQYRPTYAALLLFGRHPQQWLPGAITLAARFSGETFTDAFIKQEIRGTLPQQLRREFPVWGNIHRCIHQTGNSRHPAPATAPG